MLGRSPAQYFRKPLKGPSIMNYYPKDYLKEEKLFGKLRTLGLWADDRLVTCTRAASRLTAAGLEGPRQGAAQQARQGAAEERHAT